VRTLGYHRQLIKRNRNAAKCKTALTCSPHLTGSTVDISKKGLSVLELDTLRMELRKLHECGVVNLINERAVFHVFVHPNYGKIPCSASSD
jgi:hypothetical protein